MSECELQRRRQKLNELRMEHRWYQQELLRMVDEDERGSALWKEYREEMHRVGKEKMSLLAKLPETAHNTS